MRWKKPKKSKIKTKTKNQGACKMSIKQFLDITCDITHVWSCCGICVSSAMGLMKPSALRLFQMAGTSARLKDAIHKNSYNCLKCFCNNFP